MTNYLYLLYGVQDECYLEAAYSLGTLLKRIHASTARVVVFTDQPTKIKNWPVITEPIADALATMQGPTRFIHRTKLCVISKCFDLYPGNVVYFDSDTFVSGNIETLANQLRSGTAIMDSFESKNPVPDLAGFHTTLSDNVDYRYTENSLMYNAGVIGLHRGDRQLVQHALELCDALLAADSQRHTTEQFSISEMLRIFNLKVLKSEGVVVHYRKAKLYIREQVIKRMCATGLQPWEFATNIPYWYPAIKFMKLFGKYTS